MTSVFNFTKTTLSNETLIVSLGLIVMVFFNFSELNDPKLHVSGVTLALINLLLIGIIHHKKYYNSSKTNNQIFIASILFSFSYLIPIFGSVLFTESVFVFLKLSNYTSFFILTSLLTFNNRLNWNIIGHVITLSFILTLVNITVDIGYRKTAITYVTGTFMNKNLTAIFLILCIPFVLNSIKQLKNKLFTVLLFLSIFYCFFLFVLLHNKAILLGLLLGSVVLAYQIPLYFKTIKKQYLSIAITAFLIVLGIAVLIKPTIIDMLMDNSTLKERLIFWENSVAMIREHPLGVGGGNWQVWFPKYGLNDFFVLNEAIENGTQTVQRPHNDYLWILTEGGILAIVSYLILQFLIIKKIFTRQNFSSNPIILSIKIIAIAYLIVSFFDFPLERNDLQYVFILFIVFSMTFFNHTNKSIQSNFIKIIIPVFFILSVLSLILHIERLNKERVSTKMIENEMNGNWNLIIEDHKNIDFLWYPVNNFSIPHEWYFANAYLQNKKYKEAEQLLLKAYEKAPFQLKIINQLSSFYLASKEFEKALDWTTIAIQISKKNKKALLNQSVAHFNLKNYEMAFDSYIDIIDRKDNPPLYHQILPLIFNSYIEKEKQKIPLKYPIKSLENIQRSDSLKKVVLYEIQMQGKTKDYMLSVFDFEID